MEEYAKKKNLDVKDVKYHKGWMDYVEYPLQTLKKIGFEANVYTEKEWCVSTPLHLANTMNGAKILYENIKIEDLGDLEKQGFEIKPWLHFSFMQTGICYFEHLKVNWKDYVKFWQNEQKEKRLTQIRRADFESYIKMLEENKIVTDKKDIDMFGNKISKMKYGKVNVCPDLQVVYNWKKSEAKKLDDAGKFIDDFAKKIDAVVKLVEKFEKN